MYVSVWVWDVSICVEDRGLAFSWVCRDQMSILGVFLCCHLLYFNERLDLSLNLVPVTVGRLTEWPATSLNWLNMRLPHTGLLSGFYLSNHRVSDFIKKYFIHLSISTCPFLILLEHFFFKLKIPSTLFGECSFLLWWIFHQNFLMDFHNSLSFKSPFYFYPLVCVSPKSSCKFIHAAWFVWLIILCGSRLIRLSNFSGKPFSFFKGQFGVHGLT